MRESPELDSSGVGPASEAPTMAAFVPVKQTIEIAGNARYRPTREVGRGGMGRVLLAIDEQFDREVALKELLPHRPSTEGRQHIHTPGKPMEAIERFLREARVTGKLEHPGIVPVYEIGEREDGSAFYTMKFIRGESLADRLAKIARRTDLDAAGKMHERLALLDHFIDICEAMAYAHARGVIHRDLKPANIMLGDFGETLIVDWGLAKVQGQHDPAADDTKARSKTKFDLSLAMLAKRKQDEEIAALEADSDINDDTLAALARNLKKVQADLPFGDASLTNDPMREALTMDGAVLGTPIFMPPEQARGELDQVDEKSDVYALGAMLYQIICGELPYGGRHADVLAQVVQHPPIPLLERFEIAPRELVKLCERAMERDKAKRLPSAKAFAAEIRAFREGRMLASYSYSPIERTLRYIRRNKRVVAVAALALFIIIAGSVGIAVNNAMEFREQVEERKAQLTELEQKAKALDMDSLLVRVEKQRKALSFADLPGGTWGTRASIQRNQALNMQRSKEVVDLVQKMLDWTQAQQARLDLAAVPVDGRAYLFFTAEEREALSTLILEAQLEAFNLALKGGEHAVAQTLLSGMQLDQAQRAEQEALLKRASDSLIDAWVEIAEVAITDMQKGRGRENRFAELRDNWGVPPLDPQEWVRRLVGFQHERVAKKLGELFQPYLERVRQDLKVASPLPWSPSERDTLEVLIGKLGDIQQPEIALPILHEFARDVRDDVGGERNLAAQAGIALCAMQTEAANGALWDVRTNMQVKHVRNLIGRRLERSPDTTLAENNRDEDHHKRLTLDRKARGQFQESLEACNTWLALLEENHGDQENLNGDQLNQKVAEARINRGEIYTYLGRFDEGEADLLWVLERDTRFTSAYFTLALLYQMSNRYDKAIEAATKAIQNNKQDPQSWGIRGAIYTQLGEFERGLSDLNLSFELLDAAKQSDPNTPYTYNNNHRITRGICYFYLEQYDRALSDFLYANEYDNQNAHAWLYLGMTKLAMKRTAEAIADLTVAAQLAPSIIESRLQLAIARSEAGDFSAAAVDLRSVAEAQPSSLQSYQEYTESLYAKGEHDKALNAANILIPFLADPTEMWQTAAACLVALERYTLAHGAMVQVLARKPGDAYTMLDAARIRVAFEDWAGAKHLLDQLMAGVPKDWERYPEVEEQHKAAAAGYAAAQEAGEQTRLMISMLPGDSKALVAGVRLDDVIESVEGVTVSDLDSLNAALSQAADPEKLRVTFRRYWFTGVDYVNSQYTTQEGPVVDDQDRPVLAYRDISVELSISVLQAMRLRPYSRRPATYHASASAK